MMSSIIKYNRCVDLPLTHIYGNLAISIQKSFNIYNH